MEQQTAFAEISGWLWMFITVVMVAALGAALAYGTMRWRKWRQHPTAARTRDEATKANFGRR